MSPKKLQTDILYYLIRGPFYLVSLLPLWLLFLLSDLLFFIAYYLVPYRKAVVRNNLKNSFPEKTEAEIKQLEKRFYHHFCDFFIESLKEISISPAQMEKRVVIENPELMKAAVKEDQGILLLASHYANFEWMISRVGIFYSKELAVGSKPAAMYRSLSNKVFDRLARNYRGRWGWDLFPTSVSMTPIFRFLKGGGILALIMDQRPPRAQCTFFTPFLNQLTPFYTGTAKLGLSSGAQHIYLDVKKVSRGNYKLKFIPIDTSELDGKSQDAVFGLTDKIALTLEEIIKKEPSYWLWTHKRWKHKMRKTDTMSKRAQRESYNHLP